MFKRKEGEGGKITVRTKKPSEFLFTELDRWFEDMNRWFENMRRDIEERFWGRTRGAFAIETRTPQTDIIDTGKSFKITADVPGVPKENVEINVTPYDIEIRGDVKSEKTEEKEGGYLRQERTHAKFYRSLTFPDEVVPEQTEASLVDGVLEINVPKKSPTPEPKVHKVQIK